MAFLDRIPGLSRLDVDAEGLKRKFGILGEPRTTTSGAVLTLPVFEFDGGICASRAAMATGTKMRIRSRHFLTKFAIE